MYHETTVQRIVGFLGKEKEEKIRVVLGVDDPGFSSEVLMARIKKATTPKQCLEIANDAPAGSEEKERAFEKMDRLLVDRLKVATTVGACTEVLNAAPRGSKIERKALQKIQQLFRGKIMATNVAGNCWVFAYHHLANEMTRKAAGRRASFLLQKKLNAATTFRECRRLYEGAGARSLVKDRALKKALSFATTFAEYRDILQSSPPEEIKEQALNEVKRLLLQKLEATTSVKVCWNIYREARHYSKDVERQVFDKIDQLLEPKIETVRTVKKCQEIQHVLPDESRLAERVIEKIEGLLLADLEKAKTVEKLRDIYRNAPRENEVRALVLNKALSLCDTVEKCRALSQNFSEAKKLAVQKALSLVTTPGECKVIFQEVRPDSPEANACIQRMAALLEASPSKTS